MMETVATEFARIALDAAIRITLVLAIVGLVAVLARRRSAALRHLLWALGLGCAMCLPFLSAALPQWRVTIRVPAAHHGSSVPQTSGAVQPPAATTSVPPSASLVRHISTGDAAPQPFQSVAPRLSWPVLLVSAWATGMFLALTPWLWSLAALRRVWLHSKPVVDGTVLSATASALAALGVRRAVDMRRASAAGIVPVPMGWGMLRPVVILPPDADAWPEQRLQAALRHELAHALRYDWAVQTMAQIVCAAYWFHPLVWLAARRMRAEAERACDDAVLVSGMSAADYARHLLDVVRSARDFRRADLGAMTMAQGPKIESRLDAVLAQDRARHRPRRAVRVGVLCVAAALLFPLAALRPVSRADALATAPRRSVAVMSKNPPEVAAHFRGPHTNAQSQADRAASLMPRHATGGVTPSLLIPRPLSTPQPAAGVVPVRTPTTDETEPTTQETETMPNPNKTIRTAILLGTSLAATPAVGAPANQPRGGGTPVPAAATPVSPVPAPGSKGAAPTGSVTHLRFVGNTHLSAATLEGLLQQREGDVYDSPRAEQDRQALDHSGYFRAVLLSAATDPQGGVDETYTVTENPVVDHIVFVKEGIGTLPLSDDALKARMSVKEGQVLNTNALSSDLGALFTLCSGWLHPQRNTLFVGPGNFRLYNDGTGVLTISLSTHIAQAEPPTGVDAATPPTGAGAAKEAARLTFIGIVAQNGDGTPLQTRADYALFLSRLVPFLQDNAASGDPNMQAVQHDLAGKLSAHPAQIGDLISLLQEFAPELSASHHDPTAAVQWLRQLQRSWRSQVF